MSLIKKPSENTNAKPESLEDKVAGFKFKTPTITKKPPVESNPQPEKPKVGLTIGNKSDKPNGNGLLGKKQPEKSVEVADKSAEPSSPIPTMSDDKYEVVADASDTFSEDALDKFQQQLAMLQDAIDGTGDLKTGMVNILTFLDDNPQYKENVSPKDVAVFVAACRKVANITITEKVERKTKKAKTSVLDADIMNDLADFELDL